MAQMQQVSPTQTLDVRTLSGVSGKCVIQQVGAGPIPVNTQTQMFVDQLGQVGGLTGGIALTNADANMFGAAIPAQEIFSIFGMQFQVGILLPGAAPNLLSDFDLVANTTPQLVQSILDRLSLDVSLKGGNIEIGSILPMPAPPFDGFSGNGGRNVPTFRFPRELVLQLKGNDTFSFRFTVTAPLALPTANSAILIYAYCPASKGVPISQMSRP